MIYNEEKLNKDIEKYLEGLCIYPNYKGYNFSKDAIKIIFNKRKESRLIGNMYNELFTPISKKYNCSSVSVERGIRTIIQKMIQECDSEIIKKVFNINIVKNYKYKLTAGYFLNTICEKLLLNYSFEELINDNNTSAKNVKEKEVYEPARKFKFYVFNSDDLLGEFNRRKLSLFIVCDKLGYTYEYLQSMLNGIEEVSEKLKVFLKDNKFTVSYLLEEEK